MGQLLIVQFLTLSIYAFFVGFCFCDGFKLHIGRKLIWFIFFFIISGYVLKSTGQFDLSIILPFPTLLALALCILEQRQQRKTA